MYAINVSQELISAGNDILTIAGMIVIVVAAWAAAWIVVVECVGEQPRSILGIAVAVFVIVVALACTLASILLTLAKLGIVSIVAV